MESRCLSFHKIERPIRKASAVWACQPLYGNSVGRWGACAAQRSIGTKLLRGDAVRPTQRSEFWS
jgi:hypothetical protein